MTSPTRLRFTRAFQRDIDDILQYTLDRWGKDQADTYEADLYQAIEQLRQFPQLGRLVAGRNRELPVRHHIILYEYTGETVTVLRVIHPRRLRDR
ncbi:MAG TPA: type II toxin-antitoxin system RelE/ParE family toxin [Thermomicrobiales bacterium]|nr:type II toxin-antitoxin system RelE/ParE family toxin [Thermomicrobiales bacterium]